MLTVSSPLSDVDTACDHKLVKHSPTMHIPLLTMEEKWRQLGKPQGGIFEDVEYFDSKHCLSLGFYMFSNTFRLFFSFNF